MINFITLYNIFTTIHWSQFYPKSSFSPHFDWTSWFSKEGNNDLNSNFYHNFLQSSHHIVDEGSISQKNSREHPRKSIVLLVFFLF